MNIDDYLNIKYPFIIEPDYYEGGFVIKYPDLVGCLSQGESIEETIKMGEEAKKLWIESELEEGHNIPLPQKYENYGGYSGEFKIRMGEELHKTLVYNAKKQGISLNQYCLYLLSKNDANMA